MSWSGFKKAVNRAGAHVIMKTSKNTETSVDPDFDLKEEQFQTYESLITELNSEFSNFHTVIQDLSETNLKISKTLDSFYGDYNFDLNADNLIGLPSSPGASDTNQTVNQRDGITLGFLQNAQEIDSQIKSQLFEPMQETVFNPLQELTDYNTEIHKLIKKRGRKKFDYDVSQSKLEKLKAEYNQLQLQSNQDDPDSTYQLHLKKQLEKLNKAQAEFKAVSDIYLDINSRLKNEIDEYIALRFSLLDPSFESFMKIQQKLYSDMNRSFNCNIKVDPLTAEDYNAAKIDERLDEILFKMKSLDINNL